MQALNITEDGRANLAQIEDGEDVDLAEEKMMELQFAFMVSTTPTTKEVSEVSCSKSCVDKVNKYCEYIELLVKRFSILKMKSMKLRK